MTQQGAALQTYNNELVKSLEELKARRAALQQQIEAESLEKRKLEAEKARFGVIRLLLLWCYPNCLFWCRLEERLDVVNGSLEEKMVTGRDYDRVIQEAEQVCLSHKKIQNPITSDTEQQILFDRHTPRFWSLLKFCWMWCRRVHRTWGQIQGMKGEEVEEEEEGSSQLTSSLLQLQIQAFTKQNDSLLKHDLRTYPSFEMECSGISNL